MKFYELVVKLIEHGAGPNDIVEIDGDDMGYEITVNGIGVCYNDAWAEDVKGPYGFPSYWRNKPHPFNAILPKFVSQFNEPAGYLCQRCNQVEENGIHQ